jgi:hypothetical protein
MSTPRRILTILTTQDFADWYQGPFEAHLRGDAGCQPIGDISNTLSDFFPAPTDPTVITGFFNLISSQPFLDWYNGDFNAYVTSLGDAKSEAAITQDIVELSNCGAITELSPRPQLEPLASKPLKTAISCDARVEGG